MDKVLRFMIVFLGTYLLLSLFIPQSDTNQAVSQNDIDIALTDESPTIGDLIEITVANNTNEPLLLGSGTPPQNLNIEKYENGQWVRLNIEESPEQTEIAPGESKVFSYPEYNTSFFNAEGRYQVRIPYGETQEFEYDIQIESPGFFQSIWRTVFWKPIYNGLIGSLEITGRDLGWAIIILTLFIKLLLFIPTQNGMKAQRIMQKMQPELQKIKTRNAGNQQKTAMETMELWKKHKVNPFASILPLLLQFPVLIALFYVIQEGLSPDKSFYLYAPFADFNYQGIIDVFLGFLPLLQTPLQHLPSLWLPVFVAVVQWYAMRLAFAKMKERNKDKPKNDKPQGFMEEFQAEFQKMNGVFVYILPAMVLIFTCFLPSAVGLYWLISTIFSIGQQYAVNKIVDEK